MDFYIMFNEGEEIDFRPGIKGFRRQSVWKHPIYNFANVILAGENEKEMNQDNIEYIQIKITKKVMRKIQDDGITILPPQYYNVLVIKHKSKERIKEEKKILTASKIEDQPSIEWEDK